MRWASRGAITSISPLRTNSQYMGSASESVSGLRVINRRRDLDPKIQSGAVKFPTHCERFCNVDNYRGGELLSRKGRSTASGSRIRSIRRVRHAPEDRDGPPIGQFTIASAFLLGAERVIAIDNISERLRLAREHSGAETLNYDEVDIQAALKEMTGRRGPGACIEAVGSEADAQDEVSRSCCSPEPSNITVPLTY